ncbi:MAG: ABC transporter substrate-binding protein [Clostridiaceae bacterium]|nr:ABC transporter substrate-binding protein [Clostridiaceae bacterium]
MKKLLAFFIIIVMVFILIGCGKSVETETNQEAVLGEGNELKVLNMALFWLDANIEPTEGWHGWTLSRAGIGENLVQFDENMNLKAVIAESWETVDERTIIFHIREGVKFHNGKAVDAEAVKKSIERALDISNRDDVKFPLTSMEADGHKLTIVTEDAYPTLLNNLADPVFTIVDVSAAEDPNFKYQPIATGPFKVTSFTPDVGLTLEKHDEHWSGEVAVDIVNVKYIQDGSVRTMALQSGEIDLATQINARDLSLFENNDEFVVHKGPNLRIFLLRFNMDKPYMQHLAFRQALAYGIDKETYARELVNGVPAKGPFTDELSFGHQGEDFYKYDPQKANQLLDEAGFIDTNGDGIREYQGENIVLKYISRTNHGNDANNIGIAMQSQFKDIGIGVEVVQVENYSDMAKNGDYDLKWERWTSAPTADPENFLSSYGTDGPGNVGNYSNPEFDRLYDELRITFDKGSRDQLGMDGAELLMQDVASLFLYYQEGTVVTNKKVDGIYRFISEVYYIDERVQVK